MDDTDLVELPKFTYEQAKIIETAVLLMELFDLKGEVPIDQAKTVIAYVEAWRPPARPDW